MIKNTLKVLIFGLAILGIIFSALNVISIYTHAGIHTGQNTAEEKYNGTIEDVGCIGPSLDCYEKREK